MRDVIKQLKDKKIILDTKIIKLTNEAERIKNAIAALSGLADQRTTNGHRPSPTQRFTERAKSRDFNSHKIAKYQGISNAECIVDILVTSAPLALTVEDITENLYGKKITYERQLWTDLSSNVSAALSTAVTHPPAFLGSYNLQSTPENSDHTGIRPKKIWSCDPLQGVTHRAIQEKSLEGT